MRRVLYAVLALIAAAVVMYFEELPSAGGMGPSPDSTLVQAPDLPSGATDYWQPTAAPAFSADGVRVAFWNAEFLFDGTGDEGRADFPWKGDAVASRHHRDRVARVLRTLNADVVMLAEVENREVLEMLVQESLSDLGYTVHYVRGRDSFTRQDMGLLSRVPIEALGRTDERAPMPGTDETYGVSKNLWARFTLGRTPVTIIGLHFLSQPDNQERRPSREAQAEVIRQLAAAERSEGREVIVTGDFNDFDADVPDRKGSQPITQVLTTVKRAGLQNVMERIPQEDRYTALWDRNDSGTVDRNELSAIDHMLLSPGLWRRVREVQFVHMHDPTHGPDHFPIVVTLSR